MPVRNLEASSDPRSVAETIVAAHPNLLAPNLVSKNQVERLIRKLVEHHKKKPAGEKAAASKAGGKASRSEEAPAPLPSLASAPSHSKPSPSSTAAAASSPPKATAGAAATAAAALSVAFAAGAAAVDISAGEDGDLNKVSEEELKAAKAAMELDFERHALRPGDANYVHDKRVMPPSEEELESNAWDDEIEDVELEEEPSLKDLLKDLEM